MSNPPGRAVDQPGWYQISISGHLAPRWTAQFDGMSHTNRADGTTLIEGPVVDQAALHGLLRTLRDAGLPLISVARVDRPDSTPDRTSDLRPDRTSDPP